MSASVLNYIFLGLLIFFLLSGFIWGVIRGLKKTIFRGVWLLVFALILFFITPVVTNAIINMNLSSFNLVINEIPVTTIKQFVIDYISSINDIGAMAASNPEAMKIIEILPALIFNPIIFVLLFWLCKIVLWFVWAILAKLFISKPKNLDLDEKPKKYRAFGGLVGIVIGLFISSFTFMPIAGFSNIGQKMEACVDEETNQGSLTMLAGEEVASYVLSYNSSITKNVLKYTGLDALSSSMFNSLSTKKADDKVINLENEIINGIKTYILSKDFSNINFANLTKEEMNTLLDNLKIFINQVYELNTVTYILDNLLPDLIDEILNNKDFSIQIPEFEIQEIKNAIIEMLQSVKNETFTKLKTDLLSIVDFLKTLNKHDILLPLINNPNSLESSLPNLSDAAIDEITNSMFNVPKITLFTPIIFNNTILYFGKNYGFDVTLPENINPTKDELQETFSSILKDSLSVYKNISKDENGNIVITKELLVIGGGLLDNIKKSPLITTETFNSIIAKLSTEGYKIVNNLSVNDKIKTAINSAIDRIIDVENFKTELETIANVFDDAKSVIDDLENIDVNTLDYAKVGRVLDSFKQSYIFSTSVNDLMVGALDMICENFKSSENEFSDSIIKLIKSAQNQVSSVESWEVELTKIGTAIVNVNKLFTDFADITTAFKEGEVEIYIGRSMDILITSKLFTKQDVTDFLVAVIDSFKENIPTDYQPHIESIKNNVDKVNSWEKEIKSFKNLFNIDFNNVDLNTVGSTLDSLKNSILVGNVIDDIIISVIDEKSNSFPDYIKPYVENIKQNIKNVESWESELSVFKKLFEIDFNNVELKTVGKTLDGLKNSVLIGENLNDIVASVIAEETNKIQNLPEELKTIFNNISNNIKTNKDISFEVELNYIDKLITESEKLSEADVDVTTLFDSLGRTLDELNSSKTLYNVRTDILRYVLKTAKNNLPEKFVNNNDALLLIDKLHNNVNNIDTILNSETPEDIEKSKTIFTKEFGYLTDLFNMFENCASSSDIINDLDNLGASLDRLNNESILFNSCGIHIINIIFDEAINSQTDENIKEILNKMKNNVAGSIESGKTFTEILTELKDTINKVKNTLDSLNGKITTDSISSIETLLTDIKDFSIVGNTVTKTIFIESVTKVKDVISADETISVDKKNEIIPNIEQQISDFEKIEPSEITDKDYSDAFNNLKTLIQGLN